MKILFVSLPSIHVVRWIENLKDTSHELYWFDVMDRGSLNTLEKVHQFTGWKKRKVPYIKGEYFLRKKMPVLYKMIQPFIEITPSEKLDAIIKEINPDMIHSFELHFCSYPILKTMNKFKNIKWIYSCWGSDFYNHLNIRKDLIAIKAVLFRVDFLLTDCERDYLLAIKFGFEGVFLGVLPGGGGYDLKKLKKYRYPIDKRNVILIKGYENNEGRAINVLKALELVEDKLEKFNIIVFSSRNKTREFVENNQNLKKRIKFIKQLNHFDILQLMGKSLIYIGNSKSDGMPNTLLEALVMGAFPIQTNPGNVTSEVIENKKNGFIINDSENIQEIKSLIVEAIEDYNLLDEAMKLNEIISENKLDYFLILDKINAIYNSSNN
jgi:hypothetical protein